MRTCFRPPETNSLFFFISPFDCLPSRCSFYISVISQTRLQMFALCTGIPTNISCLIYILKLIVRYKSKYKYFLCSYLSGDDENISHVMFICTKYVASREVLMACTTELNLLWIVPLQAFSEHKPLWLALTNFLLITKRLKLQLDSINCRFLSTIIFLYVDEKRCR